jgi:hypothetical protein
MTVAALTAEWNCTRCGTTNRKLVPLTEARSIDRCSHCRTNHSVKRTDKRANDHSSGCRKHPLFTLHASRFTLLCSEMPLRGLKDD